MRRELVEIGAAISEAEQQAANGFWPGERWWNAEAKRLELTAAELRARIPQVKR